MRTAKALARMRGCAGLPEPSLVAYVISTIIACVGSILMTVAYSFEEIRMTVNIYLQRVLSKLVISFTIFSSN